VFEYDAASRQRAGPFPHPWGLPISTAPIRSLAASSRVNQNHSAFIVAGNVYVGFSVYLSVDGRNATQVLPPTTDYAYTSISLSADEQTVYVSIAIDPDDSSASIAELERPPVSIPLSNCRR
jgi:hypothetical protein